MRILDLPSELLLLIAENLAPKDLFRFRSASQGLSSLLTAHFYKSLLGENTFTALKWAAAYGHAPLAELAILKGAKLKVDARGLEPSSEIPLHLAAMHDCHDIIRILVKHGAPIATRGYGYRTPLHVAAASKSRQAIRVLVELGAFMNQLDFHQETAAQISARMGDVESVRAFVDLGLEFNFKDSQGQTILHKGVYGGKEMVEFLLEQGGEKLVNRQDRRLQTPLHLSVTEGAEIVKLLVRHGADTKVKDITRRVPRVGIYLST